MTADEVRVILTAQVNQHIANVNRAQQNFDRRMAQMERRSQAATARINRNLSNVGRLVSIGILTAAAREVAEYADTWLQVQRALSSTETLFGVNLRSANDLADMARETGSDLLALTKLYTRTAQSTRDLGTSEEDAAKVTTTVAKALKLGSANASEQASVLLQLSQAFSKGKLDGDEFRSVMENASIVQLALSRHLGKTRGEIIKMAGDGKLKVQDLIASLLEIAPEVDAQFARTNRTIGESFTNLQTTIVETFGRLDDEFGIVDSVAEATRGLAQAITDVANAIIAGKAAFGAFGDFLSWVENAGVDAAIALRTQAGHTPGLTEKDPFGRATTHANRMFQQRFDPNSITGNPEIVGGDLVDALRQRSKKAGVRTGSEAFGPNPLVSSPSSQPSSVDPADLKAVEKAILKAREHVAALELERATLGATTFEIVRRKTAMELTNEVTSRGLTVTDELRGQIELLAIQTANHTAALEQEQYQLQRVEDAAAASFDAVKQGFADVLLDAKSFDEALGGILRRFAEIALDNVFQSIFARPTGSANTGIFGFLGSLFAGGRAGGGGIPSGKYAIVGERGPEIAKGPMTVFSNAQSSRMADGGTKVEIYQSNDFRGVGAGEIARLRADLARTKVETVAAATAAVQNQRARTPGYLSKGR